MSLIDLIASQPMLIADIKNPPINIQGEAVRHNPYAYLYIDNPSSFVEKVAVEMAPQIINIIEKPFPETLIDYFSKYPSKIKNYPKKIDEDVLKELIEKDTAIILYVDDENSCKFKQEITYNMICTAVKKVPSAIFNILIKDRNKKFFTKELFFIAIEKEWEQDFFDRLFQFYISTQHYFNNYNSEDEYEIRREINKMKLIKGSMR